MKKIKNTNFYIPTGDTYLTGKPSYKAEEFEMAKPFFKNKKLRTYITHGAPALPVLTLYVNSVKLRLVMGVYSFVFGWKFSLFSKTKQFWSVPFVKDKKRKKYLEIVRKDIISDLIS